MKLIRAKEGYRKVGDKYLLAKRCTKCGEWLVASTDNFRKNSKCRYGLEAQCKECRNKKIKQWYENNKEKIAKKNKRYREANKDKIAERRKQYYEANKEKVAERHKQYYETNKNKILDQHKQWKLDNKEKIVEYSKRYYEDNRDKVLECHKRWYEANKEQQKQYYQDNKEKIAEKNKQYRQTPQGQVAYFNGYQRRHAKEEEQGTGITKDQWLEMMSFFDWRCAYSDEYIGGKQNYQRTIDHIVPLNSGGDNMIWNMVPMLRNLNSSKRAKDMLEWYKGQSFYDPKRLQKIYEWQEYAYNKWGKDTEYFNTNDIQITLL